MYPKSTGADCICRRSHTARLLPAPPTPQKCTLQPACRLVLGRFTCQGLAEAMAKLHAAGLSHGDLKEANAGVQVSHLASEECMLHQRVSATWQIRRVTTWQAMCL